MFCLFSFFLANYLVYVYVLYFVKISNNSPIETIIQSNPIKTGNMQILNEKQMPY